MQAPCGYVLLHCSFNPLRTGENDNLIAKFVKRRQA